jgi:hypothetical protein
MLRKKKLLVVLLSILFALSIVACSSGEPASSSTVTNPSSSSTNNATSSDAERVAGGFLMGYFGSGDYTIGSISGDASIGFTLKGHGTKLDDYGHRKQVNFEMKMDGKLYVSDFKTF